MKYVITPYYNMADESIVEYDFNTGCVEIQEGAFLDCKNLETIVIPSSVKKIGSKAFAGCTKLNKLKFEEGIAEISDDAFFGCTSLEVIELPYSLKKIGTNAFSKCENLKKVKLPEQLEELKAEAFSDCPNLEEINIPTKFKKNAEVILKGSTKALKVLGSIAMSIGTSAAVSIVASKTLGVVAGAKAGSNIIKNVKFKEAPATPTSIIKL